MAPTATYTAFAGDRRLASGPLERVAEVLATLPAGPLPLVFDDATGRIAEFDLRGGPAAAAAEFRARAEPTPSAAPPRAGRGRPRLGVVAREVTLLPRHWDWLATQPGGASAALRRLVETARAQSGAADTARGARDAAYRVMHALAGDRPGFEAASRALFAGDLAALGPLARAWPADVADYVLRLAAPASRGSDTGD